MVDKNKKCGGFLITEMMTSLLVMGILFGCLALSLDGIRRFNHYQLTRQRCIAAAQAQLDSISVTGGQISEKDFKRLWPKLNVSIEKSDGDGQWEKLKLIKVKTKAKSFDKNVEIELTRYISNQMEW